MDHSAMRARIEELTAQFEQARAGAVEARRRMLAVRGKAKSDDGYITVEVGHRGWVESIDIDPRIYRRPDSRLLAETITETITKAVADAQDQIDKITRSVKAAPTFRAGLEMDVEGLFRAFEDGVDDLTKGAP